MAEPDTDNLMPKTGEYFTAAESQEQKLEKSTEKAKVFTSLPLIKEIVDRFEGRIEYYSSVDSIPAELHTKPDQFMHAFAANNLMKEILMAEKEYLESLLEDVA